MRLWIEEKFSKRKKTLDIDNTKVYIKGMTKMITLAKWAKKVGVSRQRAAQWVRDGRIPIERPCDGVVLINENTKRPLACKPYGLILLT